MKNWQSEPGEVCTSEIDFEDASKVCDLLDIPLHKANFSDEYWEMVFEEYLKEHRNGRTPNPDILCNREIKFKSFLKYAYFRKDLNLISLLHNISGLGVLPFLCSFKYSSKTISQYSSEKFAL